MTDLIKIQVNENNEQVVSGRNLHEFLEINTPYTQWFNRMLEYGFTENVDYLPVSQKCESGGASGFKVVTDHILKMDMAKEIAMIQRTAKGKQARQYFIECEKAWNDPQKVLERAKAIKDANNNTISTALYNKLIYDHNCLIRQHNALTDKLNEMRIKCLHLASVQENIKARLLNTGEISYADFKEIKSIVDNCLTFKI